MVFRSKAQCEGNVYYLVEHWNAAAGHHRDALRVSLSTFTARRASQIMAIPLSRGATPSVGVDKLTELAHLH
ncbi:MAG: hypothetical protein ABFS45_03795 [Pseudomonadota bacterium]